MTYEEVEAKELEVVNFTKDLNSFKYIDIDFRPTDFSDGSRCERLEIKNFQLLESIDGHLLYLRLKAEDGEDVCFSIPDIIEFTLLEKETPIESLYKLKSFVRRYSREHADNLLIRANYNPSNVDHKLVLAYHKFVEHSMYMTHVFTLSNE